MNKLRITNTHGDTDGYKKPYGIKLKKRNSVYTNALDGFLVGRLMQDD